MKKKIVVGLLLLATVFGLVFAEWVTCPKCNGTGQVECSNCKNYRSMSGRGHMHCWACNGKGKTPIWGTSDYKTCESCDGKGYTDCRHCDGTGYDECDRCNGVGGKYYSDY